jgi:hypothetical protein
MHQHAVRNVDIDLDAMHPLNRSTTLVELAVT